MPGITTESNRVEETGLRARAGGKLYTDVIRTQEFIQPEGEVEYKLYAPGVGLITEYPPDGRSVVAPPCPALAAITVALVRRVQRQHRRKARPPR